MVKIKLKRIGKKKQPFYRIVVTDARRASQKMYIDLLGTYDPFAKTVKIDEAKACDWIGKGAQPTLAVRRLLSKEGILKKIHEQRTAVTAPQEAN